MEAARYLLRDTAHGVVHVASLLGYHDVHFFSRHFKARHGMSATAFRGTAG